MASAHSEAAKMEQIVTEFFTKTLQIIAESRSACVSSRNFSGGLSSPSSTSSSSSSSVRPRDKWFNLALRECPAALESSDLLCRGNHEPMFVDVVLVQSLPEAKSERVLERWVVHHETGTRKRDCSSTTIPTNSNRIRSSSNSNLYKKTILLLRSLYVTVRLLPAYKIYHGLNLSSRISSFAIAHRVSSFAEPFSHREEAEMERFAFTPVDTPAGRLCLSVSYNPSLSDIWSSESPTPLSSRVITDYVGSPLADPLKRFSSSPLTRCHSWGFDIYSTSSPLPNSFSPSPTRSEPHQQPLERPCLDKKDPGFDECFPSLIFALSPSPTSTSPSQPIRIPSGTHLPNSLLRSESAPIRIPAPRLTYNINNNSNNNSSAAFKQDLPPYSPLKNLRSCTIFKSDKSTGVSHIGSENKEVFFFIALHMATEFFCPPNSLVHPQLSVLFSFSCVVTGKRMVNNVLGRCYHRTARPKYRFPEALVCRFLVILRSLTVLARLMWMATILLIPLAGKLNFDINI